MDERTPKTAAVKKAERSSLIEEQIRSAQKRKEERAFLEELAKRITIAREGKRHSNRKEFSAAITAYRRFLAITAQSVNVEIEDLKPSLFEEKSRKGESLLISSIIFDMLKILDKLDTDTAKDERKLCHKLFVRFTVGQVFQMFAAENLRKYLVYRKSVRHKSEFWATYQAIKVKRFCAVATWAFESENCAELNALRAFRDGWLSSTAPGRAFVCFYYLNGSKIARLLSCIPGAKPLVRAALKTAVRHI